MKYQSINFEEKFNTFFDIFSPKIIGQLNDYHFKLVKAKGDFTWHKHDETDEAFILLDGEMRIDFSDGSVNLKKGEMFIVKKGIEHKPFAEKECKLLLIEPAGLVNTGNIRNELTAENNVWI